MTGSEIRADFKKAFDTVKNGRELSYDLDWGFSDEDLKNLAILHRDEPSYRKKIFDLLEDCNFHPENEDFKNGNYDKYINYDKIDTWDIPDEDLDKS